MVPAIASAIATALAMFVYNNRCAAYVGSSWGKDGVGNRIWNNHKVARFREKEPEKTLYKAMAREDTQATYSINSVKFSETVSPDLILLAKSASCCLFGTYESDFYTLHRPRFLLPLKRAFALNRSDPLQEHRGKEWIGSSYIYWKRNNALLNCHCTGPKVVYTNDTSKRGISNKQFRFSFSNVKINIFADSVSTCGMQRGSTIFVELQYQEETHSNAFVPQAGPDDVGKAVAIRIIHRGEDHGEATRWLKRKGPHAVSIANSIYDFLTGQMMNPDYKLPATRFPIFGNSTPWTGNTSGIPPPREFTDPGMKMGIDWSNPLLGKGLTATC